VAAALIETSLLMIYGAFYVNDKANAKNSLGLPKSSVRVFLIIIIFLAILIFALLPGAWHDVITFLLGTISTIIGFYFGTRQNDAQTPPAGGGQTPP
jgi:hypothetical protein